MRSLALALTLIISFVFAGCKKNKVLPTPTFEVVFKKDGTTEKFVPIYSTIQVNGTMPGMTDFMLVAKSRDNKDHFTITIQVPGNFQAGTYTSGNANYTVIADYFKNAGEATERDYAIDHAPSMPNSSFQVNITGIDDQAIKGTFSSNYLYDRAYNESIEVNEGVFTIKRK